MFFCDSTLNGKRNQQTTSPDYTYDNGTVQYNNPPTLGTTVITDFDIRNLSSGDPGNAVWNCMSLATSSGKYFGHDTPIITAIFQKGASTSFLDSSAKWMNKSSLRQFHLGARNTCYIPINDYGYKNCKGFNMNNSNNSRRKFLQLSAASMAVAGTSSVTLGANTESTAKSKPQDLSITVDVLVVGGGTAGTIAAIQSGRSGAKTLLLERHSQLGGAMTTGGVAFPGLFDAWGKQVIGGVGWELVKESVELDGGKFPDFSKVPRRHYLNQVHINQFLYSILAEEKCEKAGVQIAYYEFPQTVSKTSEGWQVDCVGFGTKRRVLCKQIIDCTGGAEVVGLMGHERMRGEERQPGSYLYQIGKGHNPAKSQLHRLYVHGADSTNSRTVTEANLTGRKAILKKVRGSKKRLMHMQPETGFRESYRIIGETMITVNDYTSGRVFDDAIGYAFYPVDLHSKSGVKPKPLKPGTVPTIPLGALIPKNSQNVIVAGRCISSDRLANSGLRVQASCMAMAQAAGVTAALAAKKRTTPLKVPLADIRRELKKHKAILPKV